MIVAYGPILMHWHIRQRRGLFRLIVFLILFALTLPSFLLAAAKQDNNTTEAEIVRLLAAGEQKSAETKVVQTLQRDPQNPQALFWGAVLARSRFNVREAAPKFARVMQEQADSLEGMTSACILGIDISRDRQSALYYFNTLLILAEQHPDSIPVHWMTAVMARTLAHGSFDFGDDIHKRIMLCGVSEYEKVLSLLARAAPGPGPVLIHQTMANLYDDLDGSDLALVHRQAAIQMERTAWSLQGAAETLNKLGRATEAIPLAQEAGALDPSYESAFITLGNAHRQLGQLPEAIAAWDKAVRINPYNLDTLKLCSMGSRNIGNYTAAREYAKKALAVDPENRFFKIWEARFATMLGEPGAGERALKAGVFDFMENPVDSDEQPAADPWFAALDTGDVQKIRQLIPTEDLNKVTERYKQTALMIASSYGWETIVTELLKAGAAINQRDINGDTALNYSAEFANPRITKLLMDAGADPNIRDKWKQTPLIKTTSKHNWEGFLFLLDKRTNMNIGTDADVSTALHFAAGHGEVAMIDLLIKYGADVNVGGRSGLTPLIFACGEDPHPFVITPLLKAGANVNAQDKNGRTALHHSIDPILNIASIELLLEKGADPTIPDKHGTTPISQARLLGYEDMAQAMEKKAGRPEKLQFPQFTPPADLSSEEQKAVYYVTPILLGQGNPLGRLSAVAPDPKTQKKAARKELDLMFGIHDASDLRDELDALEKFEPRYRDDSGKLSLGIDQDQLSQSLKSVAQKIHASCVNQGVSDETAWTQSHILYLADLGVDAGFISQEQATQLIVAASKKISSSYTSWPQFVKSFVLGARFHNGWQADRYQHICDRILEAGLPWP